MEHFEVDITLHRNLVEHLWSIHNQRTDDYIKHTVNEDYTNLDILILDPNEYYALEALADTFPVKPTRMSLMYVAPNAVIVPHVDGKDYGRNTAVVFPLVKDGKSFAPTSIYKDANASHLQYDNAYAFSTQVMHGVENNENERLALQVWFEEDCSTLKKMMKKT